MTEEQKVWRIRVYPAFKKNAPKEWLEIEQFWFRTSTEARIAGNNLMDQVYFWAWTMEELWDGSILIEREKKPKNVIGVRQ